MWKNYLKIAFRSLRKNRLYSFINITGLAISMTAATLIFLWVWDEWSYDKMHQQGNDIYAITASLTNADQTWRISPAAVAIRSELEIPEVKKSVRTLEREAQLVKIGSLRFEEDTYYVDSSFFQLFDFTLLVGNRDNPFPNPHTVILTEGLARKYFASQNPIGKSLTIGDKHLEVVGLMADLPSNSSLQYELLLPFKQLEVSGVDIDQDWVEFDYQSFLLLQPHSDPEQVAKKMTALHIANNLQDKEALSNFEYGLMPLQDIHLKAEDKRGQQVWIFLGVGIIILAIACINYLNLVTARASRRNKEIGIRKVSGAQSGTLFVQFLFESLVIFFFAIAISLLMTFILMPTYNHLSGKTIELSLIDGRIWWILVSMMIVTTLISGVYPAWILSKLQATNALKGITTKSAGAHTFRKMLVVTQFVSAIILIVSTIVIREQLHFIRQKDLGYQKENVFTFARKNIRDIDAIKTTLLADPSIVGVSVSSTSGLDNARSMTSAIEWEGKPASMNGYMINQLSIDRDFFEVMQIDILEGKGFTGTAADSTHYVLNETAAKQMGAEIGMPIRYQGIDGVVTGITRDFHFQDLKMKIGPIILNKDPKWGWDYLYVRTAKNQSAEAVAAVEKIWKQYNDEYAFSYQFLDDTFDNQYREDIRTGTLFNIFSGIAIIISCMGLFGMVTYNAEVKVKEIGIRKVLGASISNIMLLITKDFFKLIGWAYLIAFPAGWWLMTYWLTNFAYRIDVGWPVFVFSGLIAFLVALATVSFKSLSAASANPVKSLRNE